MAATRTAIIRHVKLYRIEGTIAICCGINWALNKTSRKHNLPNFNATENRVTELYSYACSSGEQNDAIWYIIVRLAYI